MLALRLDNLQSPPVEDGGDACVRGVTLDALIVLDGRALLEDERLFAAGVEATAFAQEET